MIRFDTKKDLEHYDNLYHQIIEKDKQLDKYKNVIDKIKEYVNNIKNLYWVEDDTPRYVSEDINELLEEVE